MTKYLIGIFLALPFPLMGTESLSLSWPDSLTLINQTVFPLVKNEIVTQEGKEFNLQTRAVQTSDQLLNLKCTQKYYAGMQVDANCIATIITEATIHKGNRLETGIAGSLRATIGWYEDLAQLNQGFRNTRACRPDILTQLYVSQERREVVFPNGKKLQVPLLTIGCYGDLRQKLVQLIVTVFPR